MSNHLSPLSLFVWLCIFLSIPAFANAQNGTLIITIKNIQAIEGNLVIGIYDKKEDFPIDGRQFKLATLKVAASEMTYSVDLPSQKEYGVAIFHDRDEDGNIDKNWYGAPTELYGFSNNIRPTFSAPSFEQVKFRLDQSKSIEINLK